jgi:hypothetical protein
MSLTAMCAILVTGDVYCWGDGDYGQLGNGTTTDGLAPSLVAGFAGATALALGNLGTCAIVGGELRCSGSHTLLANGDFSRSIPTAPLLPRCPQ